MNEDHDKNDASRQVNDPQANYGSGKQRLQVFNSFEEAAEADYEFSRNLTPAQRIEMLCALNSRAFGHPQPNQERRFYFDD